MSASAVGGKEKMGTRIKSPTTSRYTRYLTTYAKYITIYKNTPQYTEYITTYTKYITIYKIHHNICKIHHNISERGVDHVISIVTINTHRLPFLSE